MDLKIQAKKAIIIPFENTIFSSDEQAWIIFGGQYHKYSETLLEILKYSGYMIQDYRNKTEVVPMKFNEVR